jgi:hypothetical protein
MFAARLSKPSMKASCVAARLAQTSPVATVSRAAVTWRYQAGKGLTCTPGSSSRTHATAASRAAASLSRSPSASVPLGGSDAYLPITHSWNLAPPGAALLMQLSTASVRRAIERQGADSHANPFL